MIRRIGSVAFGIGAGATAAVLMSRWMRRQARKASPRHIAEVGGEGLRVAGRLWRQAFDEGRSAAAEREAEIRASLPE